MTKAEMIQIMKNAGTWYEAADGDESEPVEIEYPRNYGHSCRRRCFAATEGMCSEYNCPHI